MKLSLNIFLLAFYSFGTLCLPLGDFSLLKDIPEMYRHCKATEDRDMTAIDFLTDHLINFDCMFDKHDNGDQQKPHQPLQSHHPIQTTVSFITYFTFSSALYYKVEPKPILSVNNFLSSDYISKIFRPPCVLV